MFPESCAVVMLQAGFVLPAAWHAQRVEAGQDLLVPQWYAQHLVRMQRAWRIPHTEQQRSNYRIKITMDRLTLLTPPASEPIGLDDARLYLRVDDAHENTLIEALVKAARDAVENATGRSLMPQQWQWESDGVVDALVVQLARGPVREIEEVAAVQADGSALVLATADYALLAGDRLLLKRIAAHRAVRVKYSTGYANAAAVPAALVQAVRMLVAHYYAARDAQAQPLPANVAAMIAPYRLLRL